MAIHDHAHVVQPRADRPSGQAGRPRLHAPGRDGKQERKVDASWTKEPKPTEGLGRGT